MNTPKRSECCKCHIKPKLEIIQMGYGDRDNRYVLKCPICKLRTSHENDNELKALLDWNAMHENNKCLA